MIEIGCERVQRLREPPKCSLTRARSARAKRWIALPHWRDFPMLLDFGGQILVAGPTAEQRGKSQSPIPLIATGCPSCKFRFDFRFAFDERRFGA